MRFTGLPLIAGLTLGCAASPTPQVATPTSVSSSAALDGLEARAEVQARRIAELEARLGMLEGEAREMRVILQQRENAHADVIRIGAARSAPQPLPLDAPPDPEPEAHASPPRERRPLLRSIGEPVPPPRSTPMPMAQLPSPPPGVPDRLPVVPLPPSSSIPPQQASSQAPSGGNADRARDEYRAALTKVRDRDFDGALAALTEFLSKYPDQEFTDRAMFWRAEAFYAKRDYERALAEFEALSARFPRSEKVADAMLKIGMCHQRLGDAQRAQIFFRRVQESFPESAAARAASKEGA